MKRTLSPRQRFALILLVLAVAGLACQTAVDMLDRSTPTSVLDPIPTKTTPPTDIPTPEPGGPTLEPTPTPTLVPISQQDQLEIFEELWQTIKDVYVYIDYGGLDWDVTHDTYQQRIEAGLSTEEFYLAMDEMIFGLGDEHSVFLNPLQVAQEDAEYASGHDYVGIGIWVQFVPERQRGVILLVFPGSPAEKAGLKSRDSILSVDGQLMNDEFGLGLDLLLGIEGTPVDVTVQSPDEEPREMTITRGRITGSLPVPYQLLQSPDGKRIGYIIIPTFADSTIDEQVGTALQELTKDAPLDGLILDNRMNSGGWDNVMAGTLSYFTEGLVGHFVNREERTPLNITRRNIGGSAELPLVVLVGEDTVSFGEIFTGVLKDQQRATIIGETTLGNVEIMWGYDFKDGSRAWIAHDSFEPINNPELDWERDGIVPEIEAPAPWDMYSMETDPAILAALDFFDGE